MCGPQYDTEFRNDYRTQVRLDRYYSYQKNKKDGETEKEYFKRIKNAKMSKRS